MKNKILSTVLVALLLLTGCTNQTAEPSLTTAGSRPSVPTGADVTADDDQPTGTATAPVTTDGSSPTTTAPMTDDLPVTSTAPVTTDTPLPDAVQIPAVLADVALRYPLVSGLAGDYADRTISRLMDDATAPFETAARRSVKAEGWAVLDKGIVTLLLGVSRYDLQLSYLAGVSGTVLYSQVTTDKGKCSETEQVYIGGWMYNTSTTTENGKQTGTDNYRVQMTSEQFSDFALSGADRSLNDLSKLTELIATADCKVAGMDAEGNCVILAKGIDADLMMSVIDSDGAIGNAVSPESFDAMEVAVVIETDGGVNEIYLSLPMRITVIQSGVKFAVNGTLELTLTVDLPDSVTVIAPEGGSQYPVISIEEAYANDDLLFVW